MDLKEQIKQLIDEKGIDFINEINEFVYNNSPMNHNPVAFVKWVKFEEVISNDYNPNIVATEELKLLSISISHDGYTQPIVTIFDPNINKYVIIDGFHRYFVLKSNPKLWELNKGMFPIVVLKKDINDRMASTVRHNRARGKHAVGGMGQLIFKMVANGWDDVKICNELGLEAEELIRLKNITGVAKLFENKEFSNAWEETHQIKERIKKTTGGM